MGLVFCLLPSTKNEYQEMAVVESISDLPGDFDFVMLYSEYKICSYLYELPLFQSIYLYINLSMTDVDKLVYRWTEMMTILIDK